MAAQIFLISLWANSIASTTVSSLTSLAPDEATGNASAGVSVFAIIDREREKVDAFAGVGIGYSGGEDDVIADADNGRAMGLLGPRAGFKRNLFSAGEFD